MLARSCQLDINTTNFRLWQWVHQGTEAKGANIRDYVVKEAKGINIRDCMVKMVRGPGTTGPGRRTLTRRPWSLRSRCVDKELLVWH